MYNIIRTSCCYTNTAASEPIDLELPTIRNRSPPETDVQVFAGEQVFLFVTGQGNPEPTLTWLRDDVPINASADVRISISLVSNPALSRITSIISIGQSILSDSGRYTCVVSNEAGSVTAIFDVTVNGRFK